MARDPDTTPTLRDADVDDDMAADWADIVSRHTAGDDTDTDTTPARDAPPSDDKGAHEGKPAAGADDGTGTQPPGDKDHRTDGKFAKGNRYRRAPGKVAAKPAGEEPPGTKPAAGDTTAAAPKPGEQPPAEPQQRDITKPPTTWRPTARAAWASLPEPVRAEIHRREADFMAGQSQLLPDAKYGKDLRDVITPYLPLIEAEGGTPPLAVQDLLRTAAVLRGGDVKLKYQTIWNIAQRFGIDLRAFAPRQPPLPPLRDANGNPVPQPAPAPQPNPQEFRDPRLDVLLQSMQTDQQRRAQAEQTQTEQTAGAWLNEVDAQGNPKRPYATDVIDDMSALIPAIKQANPTLTHAQVLDLAYERATWANPEVRALLQQEQQAAADATRRAESQRRAEEARRAASVNVRRRGSPPSAGKPGTMDETIGDKARELGLIQ